MGAARSMQGGRGEKFLPHGINLSKGEVTMDYSQQVQNMHLITKGPKHGPAPSRRGRMGQGL